MSKMFSYERESEQEREFLQDVAVGGNTSIPVYSGDVAMGLQMSHRSLKDCIEQQYGALRTAYGKKVHRVVHKRNGWARALNGYVLPFRAVMQVLSQSHAMSHIPEKSRSAFLYGCFSPHRFLDQLN